MAMVLMLLIVGTADAQQVLQQTICHKSLCDNAFRLQVPAYYLATWQSTLDLASLMSTLPLLATSLTFLAPLTVASTSGSVGPGLTVPWGDVA